MSKTTILVLALSYAFVCLLISWWSGRGGRSTKKSFFMGKGMGTFVSVVSVAMGILSGLAFFGSPALCMRVGNVFLAGLGFGITGLLYPVLGYKLWHHGHKRGYMTTADFMRDRYYSNGYGVLVAIIQVFFMIPYLSAQFTAVARGLSFFTDLSFSQAILIYAALLIALMFLGGASGVGNMDVFNVALGLIIPTIVLFLAIKGGGGAEVIGQLAMQNDPNYLNIAAGMSFGKVGLSNITYWLTAITCVYFSPHIIGKMLMVKDKKTFKDSVVFGPFVYMLICTVIVFFIGAVGIALYKPEMMANGTSDTLVMQMVSDFGSPVLAVGLLWALMAFSMSTANAFTLSVATVVSNDILDKNFFKNESGKSRDKKVLMLGKLSIILVVLLGAYFAMSGNSFINDYAYGLATPGFAQIIPALLLGLYWRRVPKEAAIGGTVCGLITLIITTFIIPNLFGVHQVIWSLGINFLVVFIITFVKRAPDNVIEEFFPDTAVANVE